MEFQIILKYAYKNELNENKNTIIIEAKTVFFNYHEKRK